jgi:hypothetical protein
LERVFLVATIFLTSMILLDVFPSIVLLGWLTMIMPHNSQQFK